MMTKGRIAIAVITKAKSQEHSRDAQRGPARAVPA
jgi:hypothetical protein